MPKMPTKEQLEKMHEIANAKLNPVEVVESLLNDDPTLKELQKDLINRGIVREVDAEGHVITANPRPDQF